MSLSASLAAAIWGSEGKGCILECKETDIYRLCWSVHKGTIASEMGVRWALYVSDKPLCCSPRYVNARPGEAAPSNINLQRCSNCFLVRACFCACVRRGCHKDEIRLRYKKMEYDGMVSIRG